MSCLMSPFSRKFLPIHSGRMNEYIQNMTPILNASAHSDLSKTQHPGTIPDPIVGSSGPIFVTAYSFPS
jgi:hypothetical protein